MGFDKYAKYTNKRGMGPLIVKILIFILWIVLTLYISHPMVNYKNQGFVFWLGITLIIGLVFFGGRILKYKSKREQKSYVVEGTEGKSVSIPKVPFAILGVIIAFGVYIIFGTVSSLEILRAKSYANQLSIEEKTLDDFSNTISSEAIGTTGLPIIDKDIAVRKAEGKLGTYGAQYNLSDSNTLIHVNTPDGEKLVRVIPLEYSGFFVSFNRYSEGSVGYIMVDVVTEETTLVEVEGGMPYVNSAILNKNLSRHVWLKHPTLLTSDYSFEINDKGEPYWVVTYYDNEVGLFGGQDPKGVLTVNATTGDIEKYKISEAPEWVDRVVPVEMAYTQGNNALTFKNGWFNAVLGAKKDVFKLGSEYNFLSIDGSTYLYSGITSPNGSDETTVGFVLVDLKTKKSVKYAINGITEYRAKNIAANDQKVKAQNLTPTDPILINIEGTPTYFLTLKNGYQRLWYCLVRVSDGALVLNEDLKSAKTEYLSLITSSSSNVSDNKLISITGEALRVRENTSENSIEFILKDTPDKLFTAPISLNVSVRFITEGDLLDIKYIESGDGTALVREISNKTISGQ